MPNMNLTVKAGNPVTLSAVNLGLYAAAVACIRPKTIEALKSIVGAQGYHQYFNLEDTTHFEVLNNTASLVKLDLHTTAPIDGLQPSALSAIIHTLNPKKAMPNSLVISQRLRSTPAMGNRATGFRFKPLQPTAEDAPVIRQYDLRVPPWLAKFEMYFVAFLLADTVVEANATLTLDNTVTHMHTCNFILHNNSRVIQQAPRLVLTVRGEMQGL